LQPFANMNLSELIHNSPVDLIFDVRRGPEFSRKVQQHLFSLGACWYTEGQRENQRENHVYSGALWIPVYAREKFGVPILHHSGWDYACQIETNRRIILGEELDHLLRSSGSFAQIIKMRIKAELKNKLQNPNPKST